MRKILIMIEDIFQLILISLLIVLVWIQISSRITGVSIPWTNEISRYVFIWMVFLGSASGVRNQNHIGAQFVLNMLNKKNQCLLRLFQKTIFLIFMFLVIYFSIPFIKMQFNYGQTASTFPIPMFLISSIIPVSFTLGIIHILKMIWDEKNKLNELLKEEN